MKITYIIEKDLNFPIVEGLRKEVFLYATILKQNKPEYQIEIVNLNNGKNQNIKSNGELKGVKIINKNIFNIYFNNSDIIHYFGQPSPILWLILKLSKYKKFYINIVDGEVGHFWKSVFSMLSINTINKKVDKIYLQTKYQFSLIKKYFNKNKFSFLPPIIPEYKQNKNKSKNPSLFFMGHFSNHKGIFEQLEAYKEILKTNKDTSFIVANSGINKSNKQTNKVKKIINEINSNGGNITLKGKINPEEELSKAWIYLYTYKKAHNTFAVPLSLYEANNCNTFFITGNIGGNSEFFNEKFLIKNFSSSAITEKINYIINNYKKISTKNQLKIEINNNKIIKEVINEYEK